jgi:hypothetical protein
MLIAASQVSLLPIIASKGYTYSGYLYSSLLAHATWLRYFQRDPLDPAAGRAWKAAFLQVGASVGPLELLQQSLGPEALVDSGSGGWVPGFDADFVQGWLGIKGQGCA